MNWFSTLKRYLWPHPPGEISRETVEAYKAAIKNRELDVFPHLDDDILEDIARGDYGSIPETKSPEDGLDPWLKHADRIARRVNQKWLRDHSHVYTRRWIFIAVVFLFIAWLSSPIMFLEIPFTLLGFFSVCVLIYIQVLKFRSLE